MTPILERTNPIHAQFLENLFLLGGCRGRYGAAYRLRHLNSKNSYSGGTAIDEHALSCLELSGLDHLVRREARKTESCGFRGLD